MDFNKISSLRLCVFALNFEKNKKRRDAETQRKKRKLFVKYALRW